jgi:hypothetical protein
MIKKILPALLISHAVYGAIGEIECPDREIVNVQVYHMGTSGILDSYSLWHLRGDSIHERIASFIKNRPELKGLDYKWNIKSFQNPGTSKIFVELRGRKE